ncbi:MAG TPA: undecaprenyldiphospho-muramoylpentapeptide beta-N-acetylglucosaminyltransferase [Gammaproteobacteria bacterium]
MIESRSPALTILIAAGGTGGHVYPALEVARRLRARGVNVEWLGTRKGLESRLVPGEGFPLHVLSIGGLRGKGILRWLAAPLVLLLALGRAVSVIRAVRARLVLGMGGYAAGPGGVAAWLLRVPLLIHEQNAVPGLTNRILARFASRVLEAFPGSFPQRVGAIHVGNPVRADICALDPPERRMAGHEGPLRLLVLGGSQGARVLNRVLPAALAGLPPGIRVEIRHQTGAADVAASREAYAAAGLDVSPVAYIEDMAGAYAWADLVVCRAGAMTVSELAAAGIAAIFVPFPFAVDDHQWKNARYLSDAGAAVLVREPELNPALLNDLIVEFGQARQRLKEMARRARGLGIPDAAERVADLCVEAAHA